MLIQFKKYLESKGIESALQEESKITFRRDELNYLFVHEASDANYFRLILPNIGQIQNDNNGEAHKAIIDELNRLFKVAKLTVH